MMFSETSLYEILGVSQNSSEHQIKEAYKAKAREIHPDKNREDPKATEKFQQLNEAYYILKDPEKRRQYDQFNSLKSQFFWRDSFFSPSHEGYKPKTKTKNIEKTIQVSLEDFYNGGEISLDYERTIKCPDCAGKYLKVCPTCKGSGQCVYFSRMVTHCHICHGSGFFTEINDRCGGKQTISSVSHVDVHIDPGMEDGDRITFQGASDEAPDSIPGDLVVTLRMKENERFTRKNDDLLYYKRISLSEALMGSKFVIDHMDGRKLVLSTPKNEIITPGTVKVVEGEGMPHRGNRHKKGRLFIQFFIEFPVKISSVFREALIQSLPPTDYCKGIDLESENVFFVFANEEEKEEKAKTQEQNGSINANIHDQNEKTNEQEENSEDNENQSSSRSYCRPM